MTQFRNLSPIKSLDLLTRPPPRINMSMIHVSSHILSILNLSMTTTMGFLILNSLIRSNQPLHLSPMLLQTNISRHTARRNRSLHNQHTSINNVPSRSSHRLARQLIHILNRNRRITSHLNQIIMINRTISSQSLNMLHRINSNIVFRNTSLRHIRRPQRRPNNINSILLLTRVSLSKLRMRDVPTRLNRNRLRKSPNPNKYLLRSRTR